MKPEKQADSAAGMVAWLARVCAGVLCVGAASVWAQSGEIIIMRELSPRIATKPAESVQQGGPVRASVFTGREDLLAAGTAELSRAGQFGVVTDAALGDAVSRPITQALGGASLLPQVQGAALAGQLPASSFTQPLLSLTQGLGSSMAASASSAGQSVGSQVQQGVSGLSNSILSGVMP
jgi:hypothetical protein